MIALSFSHALQFLCCLYGPAQQQKRPGLMPLKPAILLCRVVSMLSHIHFDCHALLMVMSSGHHCFCCSTMGRAMVFTVNSRGVIAANTRTPSTTRSEPGSFQYF